MKPFDKKWLLFAPVLVIYLGGMFINVMEIDAAQYAAMSLEMSDTGSYLEIYYRGEDYIDKPPLLFWTSVLSFKLFGVSNFSYKLPSVLFTLLGLFATFRLGCRLYNERTGFIAALTLASCQAWFLINQDVRTDTILAACTILGVWQIVEFNHSKKFVHILWAAIGIAGAMLTKGPIGLMVPALAVGSDFLLKRKWSGIFQWQWLMLLVLVFILLIPMMWGLYTQYDLSGGKPTYNGVITSGLRFYFWTQSFGRLTGESTWANDTDPFFFVHTFLWSFLPWSLFFLAAFWMKCKEIWNKKFLLSENDEAITLGGILLPFLAFSLSKYKLPHYIYVFFPLVAVLTAAYIDGIIQSEDRKRKILSAIHTVVALLLAALGFVLAFFCFQLGNILIILISFTGAGLVIYFSFGRRSPFQELIFPAFFAILTVDFLLSFYIYPTLLKYQSESVASETVTASVVRNLVGFRVKSYSLDFYYGSHVPVANQYEEIQKTYSGQLVWIFTDGNGYADLKKSPLSIQEEKIIEDFHVTTLTPEFLNPRTRPQVLNHNYLLLVKVGS